LISWDRCSQIISSRGLEYGREMGLIFQNPEVWNCEEIISIDIEGTDLAHGFGRRGSEPSVQAVSSIS
jgi:hypothetical protein